MSKSSERIALLGCPNSGKSTLFNRLTGLRQKVANYPGVTVERRTGSCRLPSGEDVQLLDLPGTYSLTPRSPDEALVRDVLLGTGPEEAAPDRVVAVVDATRLERQLFLALQIIGTGRPVLLVLTMVDEAERQGIQIDVPELSRLLGVPVLPVSGKTGQGVERLRAVLGNGNGHSALRPAVTLDPIQGHKDAEAIARRAVQPGAFRDTVRARLDVVLVHRVLGPLIFLALMATIFQSVYAWSTPFMDGIEALFAAIGDAGRAVLPAGPIRSLLLDGILAGAGTVVTFLPQLAILFFFIALLEDTGYMARAAFLMDRVMGSVGLPGRAFLPLLSSFACAIPGIMAARTIEGRSDRLTTILIAPFMSCSARLPLYALLIGAFIPDRHFGGFVSLRGLTLLALYLLGIAAALAVAWLVRRTVLRGPKTLHVMELPPYRLPSLRSVFLVIRDRCLLFAQQAGTVIVAVSIVLWFLAFYPVGAPLEETYAGMLGHAIEPAIAPLGFDWKIGLGLISSIAAREVMVASLATMHHLDTAADLSSSLREALPAARDPATGLPLYTPLVAVSLMVFFALACQCMSTVAVARRETGSWRWPLFMLVLMNAMAWTASLLVYQGGRLLGWS